MERVICVATAEVKGFAKINLVLDVLRKREDGYHEVEMVMQAVDLADKITIKPHKENRLETNHRYIPTDMNNLAMKAVALMQKEFPQIPPLLVKLEKKIPVAAGLAGGSADCAAVMLGINYLFDLQLSLADLEKLAAQLGSDIPFCLGGPTALATGRGEFIQKLPDCPKLYFVLIKPEFGASTPKVYGNLRLQEIEEHPSVQACIDALTMADGQKVLAALGNVLEWSTFELYPKVKEIKCELQDAGCAYVLMSGSGPTVFAGFTNKSEAEKCYQQFRKKYLQVFHTETVEEKDLEERVKIYE